MNTVSIRRIVSVLGVMMVIISSMMALADALPVPSAPAGETRGVPAVQLNFPDDAGVLTPSQSITWKNIGADKYIVKMTIEQTGEKLSYKFNLLDICDANTCVVQAYATDLFDRTKDGQTVSWRVVSKFNEGGVISKSKSAARTFTADEVTKPVLTTPADGALLMAVHSLKWQNALVNQSYTLSVVNMTTGEKVSTTVNAQSGCDAECIVNPHFLPGGLASATTYEWSVKAKGDTGETAKSEKRTFVTP